jgi:hypothetical protein
LPLFRNLEGIGLTPQKWVDDYLNIAPRYSDITSNIYCSVEGSNQGMERIGRERIAFMIRTDAPVRTDKFEYDEDERLAIHEFESRHIAGDWHLASTKLESGWVYALIVDADELDQLQELATTNAPLADYLRKLESRHIAYPSRERPPVAQTRFLRRFPNDEEVVVMLSPFVVIRQSEQDILAVNYVNGRFVRRPAEESRLLKRLAKEAISLPVSRKPIHDSLEKLHRFRILAFQA